ncbi:MAG: hypothetical protein LQ340_002222 [Diploschistes diacapsis]|nr:MAG: hypothetical protein LQ340_002222 [Diploschistes diacapsis]
MASKQVSPAAQLLRRSRLFALPQSLPRPVREQTQATSTFESDTATIYHPIHATVETPTSSRARGDWGVKRPLPLKSTINTSTPLVRIKEVDNIDHITNFESAADHTLTLQKWQEMNIPIRQGPVGHRAIHNASAGANSQALHQNNEQSLFDVFERSIRETGRAAQQEPRRWRFKGPWLAGMDNMAFERFVEKQIKTQRVRFRQYLWNWILDEKEKTAMEKTRGDGKDYDASKITLTEKEFQTEVIRLRHEFEKLARILWHFLDLPGQPYSSKSATSDHSEGPPVTHPSAGLSYLRTSSHIHNHPLLGPQQEGPPVRGRKVQRQLRASGGITKGGALVGMGGVVAQTSSTVFRDTRGTSRLAEDWKGWWLPEHASINSKGRIILDVKASKPEPVAIWENLTNESEKDRKEKEDINLHMNGPQDNARAGKLRQSLGLGSEPLLKAPPAPRY